MYQMNFDDEKDRVYKKYWNESEILFIETINSKIKLFRKPHFMNSVKK